MEKDQAVIYAVKTGNTCHYIGKTVKKNSKGEITKTLIGNTYHNNKLNQIFINNKEISIEPILLVDIKGWYDEKLQEVIKEHKNNQPLLNAQWMLEGKRGYWEGKERDDHTLSQLSKSKYIKVCQYNKYGELIKIWDSGKEIGIKFFGDYEIIKNSGKTMLYGALKSKTLNGRMKKGYYWFREYDLLNYFGIIPKKLNLTNILLEERKRRIVGMKNGKIKTHANRYTVLQYNKMGEIINRYDNSAHAGYKLKIKMSTVQKLCRGQINNPYYILGFGEKTLQPINPEYPDYVVNYIPKPKKIKKTIHTRTYLSVLYYRNGILFKRFDNIKMAEKKLKISKQVIGNICRGQMKNPILDLRYGEKKTFKIK